MAQRELKDGALEDLLWQIDGAWNGVQRRGAYYSEHGDCLFIYNEPGAYVGDRIDQLLTVFRALDDERVIGIQLKGVRRLDVDAAQALVRSKDSASGSDTVWVRLLLKSLVAGTARQDPELEPAGRIDAYAQAIRVASKVANPLPMAACA